MFFFWFFCFFWFWFFCFFWFCFFWVFVVLFFWFFVYSTPTLKQQINPSPLERVDMHVGRDVAYLIQSRSAKTQGPGSPLEPFLACAIYALNSPSLCLRKPDCRYRLCWCSAVFDCVSSQQHRVDVGSLSFIGPSFEQHRTCVSGQTCLINSLDLESPASTGSFMIMETCALPDAVVTGWPAGAVASSVTASGTSAYWGDTVLAPGGKYRLCWCGDGICNSVQRYSIDVGSLSLIGPVPLQYARTCVSGRLCAFDGVRGEGLQAGDAWQVSSSCGSTSVLPGMPLTGHTISVTSGTVSWGGIRISSSGGQYKLCWCSALFPCGLEDFRLEVGTLDVIGPAPLSQDRTCISGTTCLSLGLTGHFIDSTTFFTILATCGKADARSVNDEVEVVRWGRSVLTAPGGRYRLCWCMPNQEPTGLNLSNATDGGCKQWTQFQTDAGTLHIIGPAPYNQRQTCISGQSCKLEVGGITGMRSSRVLLLDTCGTGMQLPGTYFGPGEALLASEQNVSDMAMYNTQALRLAGGTYRLCWCAGLNFAYENSTEGCYDSAHFQTDFGSIEIVGPWPLEQDRTCVSGLTCQIEGIQGRARQLKVTVLRMLRSSKRLGKTI